MYFFWKRIMDIAISLMVLIFFSPILTIVAILIYLDSPGPVIFVQKRVGQRGRIFNFYKFRSMVVNAEDLLYKNQKLLEEYKKNSYKILDDPRVTKIGKFIRKSSLD